MTIVLVSLITQAGLRTVPDVGPDLLQRNSSDFEFQLPPVPVSSLSYVSQDSCLEAFTNKFEPTMTGHYTSVQLKLVQ